jgi:phenylacetate-CoA ligase
MLKNIYSKMLERTVLPVGDRIEGGGFMPHLRRYRREQWLSAAELRQLQYVRLADMLDYARIRVPFYRRLPKKVQNPFRDLKSFPVMDKRAINENLDALLTAPKETLVAEASSGSSGLQGTVYMDKSAQASQRAMQTLWFEWSGYRFGDSILQTGMTLDRGFIKRTKDLVLNTAYIPAFDLDEKQIEIVLRTVEKRPRRFLFGYASSLYVLAGTALDLGLRSLKFEYAVSWGDKLFPHYRERIREAFGCETLDTYGCTEGAMIAAQCRDGNYHLSVNQCFVEIVDERGEPVPDGRMGRVLVTRLDNFAMPLIRYDIGDLAELETAGSERCRCGRRTPLLRRVIGRDTDIVLTRSGKRMIVHFFTAIFEHVPEIRQFKVVQNDLDGIEIRYIPAENFRPATLAEVERKIHTHLKEKFPIRWVETEYIAPTGSGKPQIIESSVRPLANRAAA